MAQFIQGKEAVAQWFKDNAFIIGQPLPKVTNLKAPGFECTIAIFNGDLFDLVIWIPGDDKKAIKSFEKGVLKYGVFVNKNLPFFILETEFGRTDCNLNIKKVADSEVDEWLNSDLKEIKLFLCDEKTNIIIAIRRIRLKEEVVEHIRDVLEKQDEEYESWQEVDQVALDTLKQHPDNITMVRQIQMHTVERK